MPDLLQLLSTILIIPFTNYQISYVSKFYTEFKVLVIKSLLVEMVTLCPPK